MAPGPSPFGLDRVDADDVLLRAAVQSDGDARWTVSYRVRLATENETAAFESLLSDVRSHPGNFTERFGDRMRTAARAAENETGRSMAVRNVTVAGEMQSVPKYGIVTYTFEWTNFAAVDGREIRAGDALSGLFLDEKTRLVVRWPQEYELDAARPEPTSTGPRSVTWSGPADFGTDRPRVVVREPGPVSGVLPAVGGAVVLAVVLAVLLAGALAGWRYRDRLPVGGGGRPGGAGGIGADAESASDPAADNPADGSSGVQDVSAGAQDESAGAQGGSAGAGGDRSSDGPPAELLSNEERVLQFVEQRGGRVKQQEIVDGLDWTEAKTSQVVRDLRDDDRLEGFRLGRENVLRLPEADESPASDDPSATAEDR